jgi:MtrB/PioB family decaheme-associated outer membrane protein
MTTPYSPLFLLAALGVLSAAGTAAAQADTSQWKCETCPYPKSGVTGNVDAGVIYATDDSTTFGNYTGLPDKGAYLALDGKLQYRGDDGYFADLVASDLGIDTRWLDIQGGREGLFGLRFGYAEIPRYFADGARTPFRGNGGNVLTLPAGVGFPAATTQAMPLASTLQNLELGYLAKRYDLSGSWLGQDNFTYRVSLRRDVRDGTKATAGSFFSTASQLASPVDQTTDQFEAAVSYASTTLQASVAYQYSQFTNGFASLNWDNPFNPAAPGAVQGQLALEPDNTFQQIVGSIGYQIMPTLRASADVAFGRGTQNADYLASTVNAVLAPAVPPLPAQSLDGKVDTYNGNVKLTYTPLENLRINGVYAWNVRDNDTAVQSYPIVSTSMFLNAAPRSNTPFNLTQNLFKLNADYRGPGTWRLNGGIDWDDRDYTYTAVANTRETTLWGRASVQALENLGLSFDLAYGDRNPSTYGVAYWFPDPQNPLMRNYNLAARKRGTAGARADWNVNDAVSLGFGAAYSKDDYDETVIGLNEADTWNLVADLAVVLSEQTRFHMYWQGQKTNSRQTGSQTFSAPDWSGTVDDKFNVIGMGIKHAAIPDKLDLGADLWFSRGDSDTSVQTALGEPPYPTNTTSRDVVKLYASYKLTNNLWLNGSYWYERYDSADWHLDGVQPDTVFNLLSFGNQSPSYHQNVVRISLRYSF